MNNTEQQMIVSMYRNDQSLTIKQLARLFRRKPTTISRILREGGVTPQYNRTRMLHNRERIAINRLYLQGLTMEQIATQLKIAVGTVHNIIHQHEQELSCQMEEF